MMFAGFSRLLSLSPRRVAIAALGRALCGGSLAVCGLSVAAQDVTSREVVQPLPSSEVQRLNRSLMQLARDPRDLAALLEAGEASLAVDDFDAATGFFARAAAVEQNNQRALIGLGRVYVRAGDAPKALDQFDKALAAGVSADAVIAERALALDLAGDQSGAQAAYRRALQLDPNDAETRRRMALSFAVSGNRGSFEDTLRPLLDQRDTAALRTRAFGLAIFGDQSRASAIVEQVMPRDLSSRLIPYLEFMPRLTKAQQVAAANLGIFPRAADIGRDDPRLARFAREAEADRRLEPVGAPLGSGTGSTGAGRSNTRSSPSRPGVVPSSTRLGRRSTPRNAPAVATQVAAGTLPDQPDSAPVSEPAPDVASAPTSAASVTTASGVAAPTQAPTQALTQALTQATPQTTAQTTAQTTPQTAGATIAPSQPGPGFTNDPVVVAASTAGPTPGVAAPPTPVAAAPAALRVADAFADLSGVLPDPKVGAGAVDIALIEAPREAAARPEPREPAKPMHPSRHWVQLATGRDVAALKFDWRRFERQSDDLLKGLSPHVVRWGQANRLLVGPVASRDKAAALVRQLKDKGIDTFAYLSPEGEEIQNLK